MAATNNTTLGVAARHLMDEHFIFNEIMKFARYGVAALAVLINAVIVIAYLVQKWRRPTAVTVNPAGLLVFNLLFADAFVGGVSICNLVTFSTKMVEYPHWCSVRLGVSYLAMIGSHIALINVAVDRFIAIKYTLQYRDWMTLKRSMAMVFCGWMIPVAGLVAAIVSNDWKPNLLRCSDISSFKIFLRYVWIPSHVAAILCVIVIQSRLYFCLRRHEKESVATNQILRRFSHKSAKTLFRVTTTYIVCWGPFDVMLIIIVVWFNQVTKSIYDVTLVFAQLSFLINPVAYSYQTVNIRRPVSDLWSDIRRCLSPRRDTTEGFPSAGSRCAPAPGVAITGLRNSFHKSSSASSFQTQFTSTT